VCAKYQCTTIVLGPANAFLVARERPVKQVSLREAHEDVRALHEISVHAAATCSRLYAARIPSHAE